MRWRRRAVGSLIAGLVVAIAFAVPSVAQGQRVLVTNVTGPITPVIADHLEAAVAEANETGAVLIVTMDTPGGLDTSMRDIVQTFLNAPIPVVVYVQPEGARAASAGTFITMAAHVAAMAPATSIGAATPVDLQGGEISDKILNDAAAFAMSVAERKGRSVEFAEAAVREGISLTATQAVEQEVVDLIADDLDGLLAAIDGTKVLVQGVEVELATGEASPEFYEMSILRRILALIADPNLAILILSIGTLAVVYEAANPGLGFAGIIGVILLLLGFFALSVLPVAAAGLALLGLAIALFIAEIFVPGVGVLAAGGTIALLLAGVFLFEGQTQVSPPVLWPTALVMGVITAIAGRAALKARLRPSTTGSETLIGRPVTVVSEEDGSWSAFVEGSWWAILPLRGEPVAGDVMEVVDIEGLDLIVEPVGGENES